MSDERPFYVIQCPNCGRWRACIVEKPRDYTFKCRHGCQKTSRFWQEKTRGLHLNHVVVKGETKAGKVVAAKNAEGKTAGFTTYRPRKKR